MTPHADREVFGHEDEVARSAPECINYDSVLSSQLLHAIAAFAALLELRSACCHDANLCGCCMPSFG